MLWRIYWAGYCPTWYILSCLFYASWGTTRINLRMPSPNIILRYNPCHVFFRRSYVFSRTHYLRYSHLYLWFFLLRIRTLIYRSCCCRGKQVFYFYSVEWLCKTLENELLCRSNFLSPSSYSYFHPHVGCDGASWCTDYWCWHVCPLTWFWFCFPPVAAFLDASFNHREISGSRSVLGGRYRLHLTVSELGRDGFICLERRRSFLVWMLKFFLFSKPYFSKQSDLILLNLWR
jgi:hypothetical protein